MTFRGLCCAGLFLSAALCRAQTAGEVSFSAADGFRLSADYQPAPRGPAPMVILLHDLGADRSSLASLSDRLHEAGCCVLSLDLRGHGQSATSKTRAQAESADPDLLAAMQDDLQGAYEFLSQQPDVDRARFAVVGAGVGACVALQYAVTDCSVDAIVALSPPVNNKSFDTLGDLRQLRGRRILVGFSPTETATRRALKDLPREITQREIAGDGAGAKLLEGSAAVSSELAEFIVKAVGPQTRTTVFGTINSKIYHEKGSGWLARIASRNLRHYSSPAEAESRGLRASRSKGPDDRTGTDDSEKGHGRQHNEPSGQTPDAPTKSRKKGKP